MSDGCGCACASRKARARCLGGSPRSNARIAFPWFQPELARQTRVAPPRATLDAKLSHRPRARWRFASTPPPEEPRSDVSRRTLVFFGIRASFVVVIWCRWMDAHGRSEMDGEGSHRAARARGEHGDAKTFVRARRMRVNVAERHSTGGWREAGRTTIGDSYFTSVSTEGIGMAPGLLRRKRPARATPCPAGTRGRRRLKRNNRVEKRRRKNRRQSESVH